ncbi:hypothetical protein NP233_g12615 [Leucocoprinus birnbaumii]|uniref:pyranose dehydrogenase (acceptor) n=1 Tax=Leucocoprinus birnbaumii TaxID=56174 RepID=A0AAD5VJR9_9AGAR|nr:hypothetical protein NP233_g12615 [Leucocoprinus birnbaumii]
MVLKKHFASTVPVLLASIRLALGVVFFESVDELPRNLEYDFIIAGGGTGGGTVAGRLAENPNWKILVIEAGPSNEGIFATMPPGLSGQVSNNPNLTWGYFTTPQSGMNDRVTSYSRAKLLGGCSSHNGGGYTRGSRDDWDRWANATGDNGLRWDNMLEVMKQGENFVNNSAHLPQQGHFDPSVHGFNGKLFVSATYTIYPLNDLLLGVTKELPDEFPFLLDENGGRPIGVSWAHRTEDSTATRSSSATAFIETSGDNLHVLVNTYVTRVLSHPSSSSLSSSSIIAFRGVELAKDAQSRRKTLFAKKEVIVAGGVIGTPQILMNSGIGSREELKALGIKTLVDNPSVGKNFTDQISVVVFFNTTLPNTDFDLDEAIAEWNTTHTGPLIMSAPLKNQIVWVRLKDDSPAFEVGPDPSPGENAPHIEVNTNAVSAITGASVNAQLAPGVNGTNTIQISLINLHPVSRGSIKLSSPSPFDPPIIDPGLLNSPLDFAVLREGIRSTQRLFLASVFNTSVFGSVYPLESTSSSDEALDTFIKDEGAPYLHGGCSAMMSPRGASWGVVDPDFGVKGTKGLRVIDASVFPSIPSGHTQAHVYGLAERASRMIKEMWA